MFNILVVEDDAALRKMMQSVLQRNGYRTLLAEDGEAALAVLEREQADLIITDIMMPNMDGYELTELLRQSNYNMPILMVTVKESYTDKHRGFSAGIDDYMVKPIDINEMILRVRALLRRALSQVEEANIQAAYKRDSGPSARFILQNGFGYSEKPRQEAPSGVIRVRLTEED